MKRLSGDLRGGAIPNDPAIHFSRNGCAICQCRLSVHQEARGGICDNPECRRKNAAAIGLRRQQEEAAALRLMAVSYRDEVSPRLGLVAPASLRLAIIPYYHQPIEKLSRTRRVEFRAHLAGAVRQAFGAKFDSAAVSDLVEELRPHAQAQVDGPAVGAACAVCTGFCCRGGGTRAYLSVAVIRSYIARHPGMQFREVLKAYLSRLPDATYRGSCVYHGSDGCGLSREMRSSVCNTYYCDGMQELRSEIAAEGPKTVLLLAAEGRQLLKSAAIKPDGETARLEMPGK
jgi:hypothetical protein